MKSATANRSVLQRGVIAEGIRKNLNWSQLTWCFAGVIICITIWVTTDDAGGNTHFTQHMIRHMTLVAIVAPLLVKATPWFAMRTPVNALVASVIEFIVVWGWHLPSLHELASNNPTVFWLEQFSFLFAGYLLWASVLQSGQELAGSGGLLITSMHMTLLGAILLFATSPLYERHDDMCLSAASLLDDQQTGALVMLLIGTPVYLLVGLVLMSVVLRESSDQKELN